MKVTRKTFLKQLGIISTAIIVPSVLKSKTFLQPDVNSISMNKNDKEFWVKIREQYQISEDVINLNNGAVSPQSKPVMEAFFEKHSFSNEAPSYNMWEKVNLKREPIRKQLAEMLGADAEEIAICRNTTEGLNNIIFGLNLKRGDEVVYTNLDYAFAVNTWRQREQRDGIVLKQVMLDAPEEEEELILNKFDQAITGKTKVVHLTYVINWNGQVLPVKKITQLAQSKGCKVVIDGAHSFAHLKHNIKDIGADFYATSLQKWLGAPFGTGLLYIKKEHIASIWPLQATYDPKSDDIRKFETFGTRSHAREMTIEDAIAFHNKIGRENLFNRLVELKNHWVNQLKDIPKIKMYSPTNPELSCGLATFGIVDIKPDDITKHLMDDVGIHVSSVNLKNISGVRVSPHVYTLKDELDIMVKSILKLTGN